MSTEVDIERDSGLGQARSATFPQPYSEAASYPEGQVNRRHLVEQQLNLRLLEIELEESFQEVQAAFRALGFDGVQAVSHAQYLTWRKSTKDEHKNMKEKIRVWRECLSKYCQAMLQANEMAALPSPVQLFLDYFRSNITRITSGIFKLSDDDSVVGKFGDPIDPDLAVLKAMPGTDFATDYIIRRVHKWASDHDRVGSFPLRAVGRSVDGITCVFFPVLLAASLFALDAMHSTKSRIAVILAFGIVINMFVRGVLRGHRPQVATTAGYFAVASVFVGTTSPTSPATCSN